MPRYQVRLPDGTVHEVTSAQPLSDADAYQYALQANPPAPPPASPAQAPEPDALERFATTLKQTNPVTGLYRLLTTNPLTTAAGLGRAHLEQGRQTVEAAKRALHGDQLAIPEMIGHGAATVIPGLGPAAAQVGTQLGQGDVAGAAGGLTGLLLGVPSIGGAALRGAGAAATAVGKTAAWPGRFYGFHQVMQGNLPMAALASGGPAALQHIAGPVLSATGRGFERLAPTLKDAPGPLAGLSDELIASVRQQFPQSADTMLARITTGSAGPKAPIPPSTTAAANPAWRPAPRRPLTPEDLAVSRASSEVVGGNRVTMPNDVRTQGLQDIFPPLKAEPQVSPGAGPAAPGPTIGERVTRAASGPPITAPMTKEAASEAFVRALNLDTKSGAASFKMTVNDAKHLMDYALQHPEVDLTTVDIPSIIKAGRAGRAQNYRFLGEIDKKRP